MGPRPEWSWAPEAHVLAPLRIGRGTLDTLFQLSFPTGGSDHKVSTT